LNPAHILPAARKVVRTLHTRALVEYGDCWNTVILREGLWWRGYGLGHRL